jgi:membrane fusion protein (multidrug efflux system)
LSPSPQPQIRRRRLLRALGGFILLAAVIAGIVALRQAQRADAAGDGAAKDSTATAAADTAGTRSAAADSAGADTTAAAGAKKRGFLAFLGGRKQEEKKEPEAVPVEMAAVERRDVPSYFTGTATVEAEQRAQVLAKIAGTVEEILVEEGDMVREGQVLLRLDDAEESARLEELRVRAASAQSEFERAQALLKQDLSSQREFDDRKLLAEEARAKLLVGQIRLGYTQVKAPFAGRVTQRHVHAGEYVQLNQALFDMADFDPLLVRVFMPEAQVERIRVGQTVRIVADGRDGLACQGRVQMIAPVVDTRSGTVKVTVELHEPPADLRLGSFVRVQITTDIHPGALVIPKVALIEEGGESYVFRAEADSVVKVRVQAGYTDERFVELLVGAGDGDRVVTVGHGGLKHGTKVRALPPRPAAADSAAAPKNDAAAVAARP